MATEQARRLRCVRCGDHPRMVVEDGPTYLCWSCAANPATTTEVADAEAHGADVIERRRYVIETYRWAGGWGVRL